MKRSGPFMRRKRLGKGRRHAKRQTVRRHSGRPRQKAFSEKYPADHTGPMYGPAFRAVRLMPCWLCTESYEGPGHEVGNCALGIAPGPTAHHIGDTDADGLIPCGSAAHDLFHGWAGRRAQEHFSEWLDQMGYTLVEIGIRYYENEVGSTDVHDMVL